MAMEMIDSLTGNLDNAFHTPVTRQVLKFIRGGSQDELEILF